MMKRPYENPTICARASSPGNQRLMLRLCCIKSKDGTEEISKSQSSRIGNNSETVNRQQAVGAAQSCDNCFKIRNSNKPISLETYLHTNTDYSTIYF